MKYYEIKMQHDEKSFEKLSRMQYNLFCMNNRVINSILSVALILIGIVNYQSWWGILVVALGCYLSTSSYAPADHTAHKLSKQIIESGMRFPASRFVFTEAEMQIFSLPEDKLDGTLLYEDIFRLGEDIGYYYIFRDRSGGYMLPKSELGEKAKAFRSFIEDKTDKQFLFNSTPIVRLLMRLRKKKGL